jgi:cell surface protein SprA
VVSFDTTFKNGLSANFSWDKRRTRSFSLTGAGSVTEELTGSTSLSLNYRFSAPQGLKLPFFGQKLRFQSNLDTSLTLRTSSRESRTAATEDGLLLADPTSSVRDFSVTTDATYSFSRNVSGGMQLSFAQSTDAKAERTRRTIGAHLTAEFKF